MSQPLSEFLNTKYRYILASTVKSLTLKQMRAFYKSIRELEKTTPLHQLSNIIYKPIGMTYGEISLYLLLIK